VSRLARLLVRSVHCVTFCGNQTRITRKNSGPLSNEPLSDERLPLLWERRGFVSRLARLLVSFGFRRGFDTPHGGVPFVVRTQVLNDPADPAHSRGVPVEMLSGRPSIRGPAFRWPPRLRFVASRERFTQGQPRGGRPLALLDRDLGQLRDERVVRQRVGELCGEAAPVLP
jgi:hypothetical protein